MKRPYSVRHSNFTIGFIRIFRISTVIWVYASCEHNDRQEFNTHFVCVARKQIALKVYLNNVSFLLLYNPFEIINKKKKTKNKKNQSNLFYFSRVSISVLKTNSFVDKIHLSSNGIPTFSN